MGDCIRFPQGFKIENRRLFLPKIGWLGFHKSREIEGRIKNITITRRGDRWYASIQTEQEIDLQKHPSASGIGIDAGIKCFAAFSDGTLVAGVNSYLRSPMYVQTICTNVRAKSGFNKSILDQGWGAFRRQPAYKLE